MSLLTGARTEEVRGLVGENVHLNGDPTTNPPLPPYMAVYRSARHGGDTKTARSRRTIALPGRCVVALREHRVRQDRARTTAGDRWLENSLVFASEVGTPLDASNVRRMFAHGLANAYGVHPGEWTPRELRHSFVSLLSDRGIPLAEIAAWSTTAAPKGPNGSTATHFDP